MGNVSVVFNAAGISITGGAAVSGTRILIVVVTRSCCAGSVITGCMGIRRRRVVLGLLSPCGTPIQAWYLYWMRRGSQYGGRDDIWPVGLKMKGKKMDIEDFTKARRVMYTVAPGVETPQFALKKRGSGGKVKTMFCRLFAVEVREGQWATRVFAMPWTGQLDNPELDPDDPLARLILADVNEELSYADPELDPRQLPST